MNECGFCHRELTEGAFEFDDVFGFAIDRLLIPGRGRQELSKDCCSECADEILELVEVFKSIDINTILDNAPEEYWVVLNCSFCEERLEKERGILTYWSKTKRMERRYALCTDCIDIVQSFLDDIPEEMPEENRFIGESGDIVKTPINEADKDDIAEQYRNCSQGDYVRFEAHNAETEQYPDEYTEAEGQIVEYNVDSLMGRMVVVPLDNNPNAPSKYLLRDPMGEDRSIAARAVNSDESTKMCGFVTVLEIVD